MFHLYYSLSLQTAKDSSELISRVICDYSRSRNRRGRGDANKRRVRGGGGKLSTPCFIYEAAHMCNLDSFFISMLYFWIFSLELYILFKQYTMVMTKLQHKTDQLALTIVKIRNSHSVVFFKIQSCIKIAPYFEGTYKLWVIVL